MCTYPLAVVVCLPLVVIQPAPPPSAHSLWGSVLELLLTYYIMHSHVVTFASFPDAQSSVSVLHEYRGKCGSHDLSRVSCDLVCSMVVHWRWPLTWAMDFLMILWVCRCTTAQSSSMVQRCSHRCNPSILEAFWHSYVLPWPHEAFPNCKKLCLLSWHGLIETTFLILLTSIIRASVKLGYFFAYTIIFSVLFSFFFVSSLYIYIHTVQLNS